ncbi:MAG: type IV pilin [Euryarchaeota archaeon]|nr:type IV pilin [Euryarchaeota archaeon]
MRRNVSFIDEFAVSEVVGAMILVLIAIVAFAAIYMYVFPLPLPAPEPTVKLKGYVTDDGTAVLEHMGGESLPAYKIDVRALDGTIINTTTYKKRDDPWEIGECNYPPTNTPLLTENDKVNIDVYEIYDDGSFYQVFTGILAGKGKVAQPSVPLMLISSLMTDTIDEDLICYNYTIDPNIDASTYVYNWIVSGNPITKLLMPFDTDSSTIAKDYSSNGHNGTVIGPIWINGGVVGGAYQFDGVDDHISIPYCFDSSTIDKITVETWVKTTAGSGVIASFDRKNYLELGFIAGKVRWSTTATDGTKDTIGKTIINDGIWHHAAATYDASTGKCAIYVDGKQDIIENGHNPGLSLGLGTMSQGSIGTGAGISRETIFSTSFETQSEKNNWKPDNETWGGGVGTIQWGNLLYDNFNSGWGSYTKGGIDTDRSSNYKHEGTYSAYIRHQSAGVASSFYLTNPIDVDTPKYTSLKIDFWWMWRGTGWTDSTDDWWLRYYNGTAWQTVLDTNYPSGFSKDTWYHKIVYINETNYRFPTNMNLRFQCDARSDNCLVYIDQIYINATTGGRFDYDFDLRDSTKLTPRTGIYSIGGTGDFDPDYAIFNRTGIDVSGYKNVKVSVWYSYKSTGSEDKVGLYYKDGSNWVTIFKVLNPNIGIGNQLPWTHVEVQIPDHVDNLALQFNWSTSSTNEYVAIDDLEITGEPLGAGDNFSGVIDEFLIYNRALSSEQIYQNYLCMRDGHSDRSVIVSGEIKLGDIWKCIVTPNDGTQDDTSIESNIIQIVTYPGGV